MASDDRQDMRVVTLKPAAEISYLRYLESLAEFTEAYEVLASILAESPYEGRRIAGGRREYRLARKDKRTVCATYAFDDGELSVFTLEAS